MIRITVNTNIRNGHIIEARAVEHDEDNKWHVLGQRIIDIRDSQIRDALINLGWRPPNAAPEPRSLDAMLLAMGAHGQQVRKYTGEPYFHHLAEVAGMVAAAGGPSAAICAAWLHDIREDQGVPSAEIAARFGTDVEALVSTLSDLEEGNRAARKAAARARLSAGSYWAQTIKYADIISNAHSIRLHDPKFAVTFCAEVQNLLDVMDKGHAPLYQLARLAVSSPNLIP